jgi:hypothetical protein
MIKGDSRMNNREPNQEKSAQPKTRRPYVKPAFSSEQVFEISALACNKGGACGSMNS